MSLDVVTTSLRTLSPHFQRSINLTYDAGNADYVASYIPTPNGAQALATVFDSTISKAHQRAHVFHAAYGSGKSLLGLVLSAIASRDTHCQEATSIVLERLARTYPEQAQKIDHYLNSSVRLLPVILSGNEGHFTQALTRALTRSLAQNNIPNLRLHTQFQAAADVVTLWENNYPDAYRQLQVKLADKATSVTDLTSDLQALKSDALTTFEQLYPEIAAGAHFEPNTGSLDSIFHATAEALQAFGYTGILIIWDEFGRFLDSRVGDAFGSEAALLQSFAEFCNRSGSHPVHLVLITHRLIAGYATELPLSYQHEWARIAERFYALDVSSDPSVTYRLIAEALTTPDVVAWQTFSERYHSQFNDLTAFSLQLTLFDEVDDAFLRQYIIERAWPLHPLSLYALPRLANRVAQNERTLFTFLAAEEQGTLAEMLSKRNETTTWWMVRLDDIWNYFADAIRMNVGPDGAHTIWSGAMYALGKADKDDSLAHSLIKALAVLLIVSEANIQAGTASGKVIPTTEILAWALDASKEDIESRLKALAQRRAVLNRRSDGYWTFTRGSDIDLDAELSAALERHAPNQQQIRQTLENEFQPPFHLPRGYNQERCITRFFRGHYCWPEEVKSACTEVFLKQLKPYGYADGAVIYVLATNEAERDLAIDTIRQLPAGRTIYIIPDKPLLITEAVRDLFALRDLSNDPGFLQQDERLPREIAFFIEDAQRRLIRALNPFLEADQLKAACWWYENDSWRSGHLKTEDISQLLSRLCDIWFNKTPVINNELVNQHEPSGQQERAMEKVIGVLLEYPHEALPPDFNLPGHGPDWLILRTLLVGTGLLELIATGQLRLREPANNTPLAYVWTVVQDFIKGTIENESEFLILIDKLQSPPFGLRRGVLPLLLAAMLRHHLPVLTIRRSGKIISPITGQVFIALCKEPEEYTLELSPWDMRRSALWMALKERVGGFLTDQEQTQQPLNTLSLGLLRWLQSQPRYCRDTNNVSAAAQQFRNLIRKSQRQPSQVLAYDLLEMLDDESMSIPFNKETYKQLLLERLSRLMDEIATAYQTLLYSLDQYSRDLFTIDASDGHSILHIWLASLESKIDKPLDTFRFSDKLAQKLVQTARQNNFPPGIYFWDQLSRAILGIALTDWNDTSYENFKRSLSEAKERLEHEIFEIAADEKTIQLSVSSPTKDEHTYRFRPSSLSPQGQRILQNFKSTLEIAGRPLSLDEKRQIVMALLDYVMEGTNPHD